MKLGNTIELERLSSSSYHKPSFQNNLKIKKHLLAFTRLDQMCTVYLQFSWNVTPNIGSSVHCGMLCTSDKFSFTEDKFLPLRLIT